MWDCDLVIHILMFVVISAILTLIFGRVWFLLDVYGDANIINFVKNVCDEDTVLFQGVCLKSYGGRLVQ